MKRRISAALLTLCLLMSLMPTVAFAAPSGSFDDVDGHWGQAAVERWAGYGVVNGDGTGNFNPDNQMTRAEFATMLANMLGYKEKATNTFSDVNDSDWFADAILKLAAAGVIQGSNGMANPNAPISRQEAAVMMCRAFNIPTTGGSLDFADSADVADWAKGAVAALASRGMMNGVGGNNVAPLANINRASVATLLDNMITEYVTEDKTVSGEVKGIVLVAGNATVTFEDATLAENLIVAPKAEGAEVVLTGSTTAGDVYVDGTATVKVDSSATAGDVQVGAANSTVEVAGKADTVTVDSAAADTKVNVGKDATVGTVDVAGANTAVTVDGKVDNVNVSSSATGTDVVANSGATVGKVETAAKDVTVSGNGKVENVTATDGTVAVTTPNTNVTNKTDSADNVTNQGKPVPPENGGETPPPTPPSGGNNGGSTKPPATTYTIAVTAGTNGTIAASAESAAEGTTVTVTGTPDAGYALKSVTVTKVTPPPAEGEGEDEAPQAGETETIDVTPAGDNKFTFTMPASNVTVSGEFVKPLENFKVAVINSKESYKSTLPEEFRNWDGGVTDGNFEGWDNLPDYPWLAIVAEPAEGCEDGAGTLEVTFDGKAVTLPWGGAVIGSHGALTAYVKTAPEDDSNGDALGITENFGDFAVTLKYMGATYIGEASYIAKGTEAYKVTFNSQGGSNVASKTVAKNSTVTKPADPTKTGYTFGGWFKEENCTTAWDFGTNTVTEATTLYAKWEPIQFTVTFDGTDIDDVKANYGTKITKPATDPAKAGYYFVGWYKDEACTTAWDFANDTITGNTTLYPKFMEIKTVTASLRSPGHAKDLDGNNVVENFDYAAEYNKAGISIQDNTVTVNGTTLKAYLDAALAQNAEATLKNPLAYMSINQDGKYLMFGIELSDAPANAAKVYVNRVIGDNTDNQFAGINMESDTPIDITQDTLNSFDGKYVDYFGAAGYSDSNTPYSYQGAQTRKYYLIWMNENDEIIAVQQASVQRTLVNEPTTTDKDA
ncbi:MAG: hypothetical protein HFE98_10510 [Ruminiclostridium sp.]|nr:hypothetical protein [Ruminiclostridium sp.]